VAAFRTAARRKGAGRRQVDRAGCRRRGFLPLGATVLALIVGCTSTGSPTASPSAVSSPASPTSTGVATPPAAQPGRLSCADAYTTDPVGDLPVFTAAGVGFDLLNDKGQDPIVAETAGFSSDAAGYFLKSPVYLDKGVSWAEVTVIEGDATFLWVPAGVWTGPPGWSVASHASRTARLESCTDSYTGFLGGVLTPIARECVTLGLRSDIHPEVEEIRVAIGKGACD